MVKGYDVKKTFRSDYMLLNFKIKNVFSFKELTEFSMIAGSTKRKSERVYKTDDFSAVKFSAIYGANASGKSNFITALSIMQRLVISGIPNYAVPFFYKLDDKLEKESSYFEVELSFNKKNYAYGFTFFSDKNEFESEWLYELKTNGETMIFERNISEGKFDFNIELEKGLREKFKVYIDDLKEDKSTLFLSSLKGKMKSIVNTKADMILKVLAWFYIALDISSPNSILTSSDYYIFDEKTEKLAKLLNSFDTGIKKIVTREVNESEIKSSFNNDEFDKFKFEFNSIKFDKTERIALLRGNRDFYICVMEDNQLKFKKVLFLHENNREIEFSINEESEGTIRLLDLAEVLLTKERNKVFVIDELDRCLHPQITIKFINLFLEKAKTNNNQLIVTTHESRLLDFEILRRDEIWFVEKNNGESKMFSFEEFNERFDKKIDKAYLDGRYGGVPIFNNIFPMELIEDENK